MIRIITVGFFLLLVFHVKAQDPIFTQFTLVPETINPAFTGVTNTWSAGIMHRRQWPNGNTKIDTQFAYANNLISDQIAVGITVLNHNEVFTNYNYFKFNGVVSYILELNYDWRMRFGVESGFGRKDFNFNNLVLEDQIDSNTGAIGPGSIDPGVLDYSNKINFFDVTAGFAFDSEDAWFGLSVRHLNRPDVSFRENANVPLNMFFTLHGGYYFEINNSPSSIIPEDSNILLTANYMRQSQYNRLDMGVILETEVVGIGALLATNPEGRSSNSHLLTSINPIFYLKMGEFTIGYSHDFNLSEFRQNQGVHEFSLIWQSSRDCSRCNNYKVKLKKRGGGYQRVWL
jgi:type IX secretion system PorP/SprF family membrane protein